MWRAQEEPIQRPDDWIGAYFCSVEVISKMDYCSIILANFFCSQARHDLSVTARSRACQGMDEFLSRCDAVIVAQTCVCELQRHGLQVVPGAK